MSRPSTDSRHDILHTAAQLFRERGYDAASMNDLAAALNLSKGALYHHFQSKDEILFHIMEHAMEITEEQVKKPVLLLADAEERLRANERPEEHNGGDNEVPATHGVLCFQT
jgi:AcrR family transcriptional regulator